jgi:hypothetical protein
VVVSGASEFHLSSSSLGAHPYQQPQTPQQVLVVKAPFLAPLLAPLVAAGKTALAGGASAIASQGLGGAARIAGRMASKKVGELASKEGIKRLAQEGGKTVALNAAMDKLRQEQQKKEAENRQMQQELMEAGRGGASTGSTTMG